MATILDLLAALNNPTLPPIPAPAKPVGLTTIGQSQPGAMIAPSEPRTMEDMARNSVAPVAPTDTLDQNLIQQIMALAPPAPTAPASLSRGQRIANALIGFGAGVQGNGPQFLQQLQQPQREYQQQLQAYNNERSRFGLTALEAAQNKQERAQAERQRRADIQAQRDFEVQLDKMKFTNETAKEQARQAFLLEQETRKEKAATDKLTEQQNLKFDEDLGRQIRFYKANGVKDPAQARRIAINDMADTARRLGREVPPLTAADNARLAKVDAEINKLGEQAGLAKARAARQATLGAGGGAAKGKPVAVLEDGSQVPISKVDTKNGRAIINGQPKKVVGYTGGGASQPPPKAQQNDPGDFRRY